MLSGPHDKIVVADLHTLVTGAVRESRSLDYKRDLVGGSDNDRREFLADVSSFANTIGGDILFGVEEADGTATALPGVPTAGLDAEILRLEQMLASGLEPRVVGVSLRPVDLGNSRSVLLVHVPQSWNGPHRVIFREHSKFYGRNSAGKYALDVDELRRAFVGGEAVAERVRRWRANRIAMIGARETPVQIHDGAVAVLHAVPLAGFTGRVSVDVGNSNNLVPRLRPPYPAAGYNYRFALDGLVTYTGALGQLSDAYAICSRNGALELVCSFERGQDPAIPSSFEKWMIDSLGKALGAWQELEIEPPYYVLLSLLGVRTYRLATNPSRVRHHVPMRPDRDVLVLPELVGDNLRADTGVLLHPLFDMVWNAWGFARSFNYTSSGVWQGD